MWDAPGQIAIADEKSVLAAIGTTEQPVTIVNGQIEIAHSLIVPFQIGSYSTMDQKPVLVFMRHAKSSWANAKQSDFERPLNERGQNAAPKMARFLVDNGFQPQQILSSSSQRTVETVELLNTVFKLPAEVTFLRELYLASPIDILEATQRHWSSGVTLVLGHNPGMELLIAELSGQTLHLPTAGLAVFRWTGEVAPSTYAEIGKQSCELVHFTAPKLL